MEVTVIDLLHSLAVAVPAIMVGTNTVTAAIHGAFDIQNKNVNHAISWVVAVLIGLGFVAFNGLNFGLTPTWNYIVGGIVGLVSGGASNGFYDWDAVAKIFNAFGSVFRTSTPKNLEN